MRTTFLLACLGLLPAVEYSWQQPQAEVLPQGDLAWQPLPYRFQAGTTLRYIDFEAGNDQAAGTKDAPWQHHPWDPAASGQAADHAGVTTYVFKGGVAYRGALRPDENGTPAEPIRLTRDPDWGTGAASILGSRAISGGWQQGAQLNTIPEADRVWWIDLDTDPRRVWLVDGEQITRLHLARDPNWTLSNPQDPMAEWYVWDNPKWWTGANTTKIKGRPYHWCIDQDVLDTDLDLTGATVWTQWMPVMSSPYPHPIITHDRQKAGVAFGGPWVAHASSAIWEGCRYYLEDKAEWLDSPGEFWFDRKKQGGRLYLRLPNDRDPNTTSIEVAEELNLIDAKELRHIHISGLRFAFTDDFYDFPGPQWSHPDKQSAVIRLQGDGEDIVIDHCLFEHVKQPVRLAPPAGSRIDDIAITDNTIRYADHGAVRTETSKPDGDLSGGITDHIDVLRNHISDCGFRVLAGDHGHVLQISARSVHIAGNILKRLGASGINVNGGHNGADVAGDAVDYARYLIHHNKVTDSLLQSCDWGAFYQHTHSGPSYFWSNIAINPVGQRRGKNRLGMAYYLDGAYKCFLFNNIAVGLEHDGDNSLMNKNAFKSMVSFQNTFFNNTVFRWANASDRQSPQGNREKYIGNIFADIGDWVFHHNKPRDGKKAANAAHEVHRDAAYRYETMVYQDNVIHAHSGEHFGVFIPNSVPHDNLASMQQTLTDKQSWSSEIGVISEQAVLTEPSAGDYRPRPGSAVIDQAPRVFVPWTVGRTVAEWHFTPRTDHPDIIEDEHWYQTAYYVDRSMYRTTPRYHLLATGVTRGDFVAGELESWTDGALRLDDETAAILPQATIAEPFRFSYKKKRGKTEERTIPAKDKQTVDIDRSDLLIELVYRGNDQDGILVDKMSDAGYRLSLESGKPHIEITDQSGANASVTSSTAIADDNWHHLVLEVDRDDRIRLYIDGESAPLPTHEVPSGSLRNQADFRVGAELAMDIDFLRVARATLAASRTDIDELRAWQFDGPQFRDFAGQAMQGNGRDAGALEAQ
jgi:hypothetical protein